MKTGWAASAIALALALVLQPNALKAQDAPVLLQPLGDWQVQRLDDRCVTRRAFGDAARPTVLELRQIDPWDGGFHTALTSAEFALVRTPVKAAWLPGGREANADLPTYLRDASGRNWVEIPHGLWDGALDALAGGQVSAYFSGDGPGRFKRQVETLRIVGAFDRTVVLRTGPMDGVVASARQCMLEMLTARGIDPDDMTRGESRAVPQHLPSQARILSRLPSELRTRARPSMIEFVLYLDQQGRPTSCRLSTLPAYADFEAWGCGLLMHDATFGFAPRERPQPTFFKASILYQPR
jgi:hypothetical protein